VGLCRIGSFKHFVEVSSRSYVEQIQ
jgi:hypothetical protein